MRLTLIAGAVISDWCGYRVEMVEAFAMAAVICAGFAFGMAWASRP